MAAIYGAAFAAGAGRLKNVAATAEDSSSSTSETTVTTTSATVGTKRKRNEWSSDSSVSNTTTAKSTKAVTGPTEETVGLFVTGRLVTLELVTSSIIASSKQPRVTRKRIRFIATEEHGLLTVATDLFLFFGRGTNVVTRGLQTLKMPAKFQRMAKQRLPTQALFGQWMGSLTIEGLNWFMNTVTGMSDDRRLVLFPSYTADAAKTLLQDWIPRVVQHAASSPPKDTAATGDVREERKGLVVSICLSSSVTLLADEDEEEEHQEEHTAESGANDALEPATKKRKTQHPKPHETKARGVGGRFLASSIALPARILSDTEKNETNIKKKKPTTKRPPTKKTLPQFAAKPLPFASPESSSFDSASQVYLGSFRAPTGPVALKTAYNLVICGTPADDTSPPVAIELAFKVSELPIKRLINSVERLSEWHMPGGWSMYPSATSSDCKSEDYDDSDMGAETFLFKIRTQGRRIDRTRRQEYLLLRSDRHYDIYGPKSVQTLSVTMQTAHGSSHALPVFKREPQQTIAPRPMQLAVETKVERPATEDVVDAFMALAAEQRSSEETNSEATSALYDEALTGLTADMSATAFASVDSRALMMDDDEYMRSSHAADSTHGAWFMHVDEPLVCSDAEAQFVDSLLA